MIKITDVKIKTSYSWDNLENFKDWNTIRLCNPDWNSIKLSSTLGMQVRLEVTVIENTWELLKESYQDWQMLLELPSWAYLKTI